MQGCGIQNKMADTSSTENAIVWTNGWTPGTISWMLTSAAFVFMMTLGLAFFYGSLCRDKHIIDTLAKTCIVMGIASVQWLMVGVCVCVSV